jgi:nitrate/nitrite transport system ATP-binding protein
MIRLESVGKRFTSRRGTHLAVSDVSLTIDEGQFVCLLGPSGCGKSTLLNLIAGLERADSGRVTLDGKVINAPGPERSVMFQDSALFPWLTARKNVDFGLELAGFRDKDERAARTETFLKKVHLWRFRDAYVHELSGGMKQRVGLARALAMEPKVLLLDEPFGALDALTRTHLQDTVMALHQKLGNTVMMITHDVDEAVLLSDRIVMMTNGPSAQIGEILAVPLGRPRKRLELVADATFLKCRQRVLEFLYERHRFIEAA